MTRSIAYIIIAACIILFALAQARADSERALTLEQCLDIAKNNSLSYQQAQKSSHIALLARKEISATAYPQVRLEGDGIYAPVGARHGYDPAITDQGELRGQVVVEQSLYDGGIRGLKKAQVDLDISRLSKEQQLAVRELEYAVTQTFIEALKSQTEVDLRSGGESTLYDYYLLVKSLHAAGTSGYTDVLSTQAKLLSDSLSLAEAEQNLTAGKLALTELLGAAGDTSFTLAGNLDEIMTEIGNSSGFSPIFDSLQNIELSISQLEYKRSQYDIRTTQRELLPNLSITGDLGYLSSRDNLLIPPSERVNGIGYEVGFNLGMPIFDWGGRRSRIQQLQLTSDSLKIQTDILRRSIITEYSTALSQLSSARNRLRLAEAAIGTASDNFDLIKSKYAGGAALTLEVLDAYQSMEVARLSKLDLLAEIATLSAKIKRINAHE